MYRAWTAYPETIPLYLGEQSACRERLANGCLDVGKNKDAIQKDAARAGELSIDGTPTFLLGKTSQDALAGVCSAGAQPYAAFEAAIKQMAADK